MAIYTAAKAAKAAKTVTVLGTARQPYYAGIGKDVKAAGNVDEAMRLSGLDFIVEKKPIQFLYDRLDNKTGNIEKSAKMISNAIACVRMDTKECIGINGKNYTILQNNEAFNFLDSLGSEIHFEAAGSFSPTGAKSFIVINTEPLKILNDDFDSAILLANSFDGSSAVKAMFTPMKINSSTPVIRNIRGIHNRISIKHTTNLKKKLDSARLMLLSNSKYLDAIKAEAEKQALTTFTDAQFKDLARQLFASAPDATDIQKLRNEAMIDELISCYNQADLVVYNNTAYKATMAVANFESKMPAFRETKGLPYKNINNVIKSMPLYNQVVETIMG